VASDAGGASNTATRQVAVTAVNDAPVNAKPAGPTIPDVNWAIDMQTFTPTNGFSGAASLQLVTNDQGNTGSGGTLTDDDTLAITVQAVSYYDTIWAESSLLNYYRMADTSGTAIDDIETANNNGTYAGSPTMAQAGGISGNNSVLFDGVDDYGSIARQISADFSIEFWFKSTQGIGTDPRWSQGAGMVDSNITGINNDFGISLRSDGVVTAGIGGGPSGGTDMSIPSAAGFNNGVWRHVVMTRVQSTGSFNLYIDGSLQSSGANNTGLLNAQANITFGRLASGANYIWATWTRLRYTTLRSRRRPSSRTTTRADRTLLGRGHRMRAAPHGWVALGREPTLEESETPCSSTTPQRSSPAEPPDSARPQRPRLRRRACPSSRSTSPVPSKTRRRSTGFPTSQQM